MGKEELSIDVKGNFRMNVGMCKCRDCKFYKRNIKVNDDKGSLYYPDIRGTCLNEKNGNGTMYDSDTASVYDDSFPIGVGEEFGCIHFEPMQFSQTLKMTFDDYVDGYRKLKTTLEHIIKIL